MLEAGQRYGFVAEQIIADFHNRGRGVGHGAEKFQAHGARVLGMVCSTKAQLVMMPSVPSSAHRAGRREICR